MEHKDVLKFIDKTGHRTRTEVNEEFPGDPEMLEATLQWLASRNQIRRVKIASAEGNDELLYVPA